MQEQKLRLCLFFSRGMSLAGWERAGILERELALYAALSRRGVGVTMITYGDRKDLDYRSRYPQLSIKCNSLGLPMRAYERLMPVLHAYALASADIVKTNQIQGALQAARAARIWRKPLFLRCGYLLSDYLGWEFGRESERCRQAALQECELARQAAIVAVPTSAAASDLSARLQGGAERICIHPNYVATDVFHPLADIAEDIDLLFVGRLSEQKGLMTLIEAISSLSCRLVLAGEGPLRADIQNSNPYREGRIELLGNVPNRDLPLLLNRARLVVLPSLWEGHPKSLLEAMACGRAVLGSDIASISSVIRHAESGWISKPTAGDLRQAIALLLSNPDLRSRLGSAALRQSAAWALEAIADAEFELICRAAA